MQSPREAARHLLAASKNALAAMKQLKNSQDFREQSEFLLATFDLAVRLQSLYQRLHALTEAQPRSLLKAKKSPRRQPRNSAANQVKSEGETDGMDVPTESSGISRAG